MISLLLFLGTFALYLITLSGTVPAYRDSGDLINAVYTFGIAHPPGYPLYILLGKLFTRLFPWGNPAYRVNAFSAFCAAGSVVLLYWAAKSLLRSRLGSDPNLKPGAASLGQTPPSPAVKPQWVCLVAAVLFAFTPAVLSLARVAEMYTLAACFAAGILLCSYINTPESLLLGSFLLGCGFGAHPTLLFMVPLLIPLPDSREGTSMPGAWLRLAGKRLGFFLLGLSVVFYLLVRARTGPAQNWGDPTTLFSVWRMITRSYYGGLKLHPQESQFSWTPESIATQLQYFLQTFWHQWGWVALGVGLLGLVSSLRTGGRLFVCWALAGPCFFVLSNLPIQENTTAPILEPYLVLVNLIWALWVAQGLYFLLRRIRPIGIQVLMLVVLASVPLYEQRDSLVSSRQDFFAYDLGRNILRTLPRKAVMYDPDDQISFTLRVLQLTENRRTDIVPLNFFRTLWGYQQILKRWPDLLPPIPVRNAQELEQLLWNFTLKVRPMYADLPVKIPPPLSYQVEGLLYHIQPKATIPTVTELTRADGFFTYYVWRGDWRTTDHPDFFTQHIFNYYAAARCNLGLKYAERRDWPSAMAHYRQALCIDPHLAAAYNDIGVAAFEQHFYDQSIENYQQALGLEPENTTYRRNLALAYQSNGQIAQAQATLQTLNTPLNP